MSEMFRNIYNGSKNNVTVVGAGGHVGLPLSLLIADSLSYNVYGLDVDQVKCDFLNSGRMPFLETDSKKLLLNAVKMKSLVFGTDRKMMQNSDYVIIIIGTPVDEEGNASTIELLNFVKDDLCPNLKHNAMVILRSTVTPGTTDLVKEVIENQLSWKEGKDFYLVYAPERVQQGNAIAEMKMHPQLIGVYTTFRNDFVPNRIGYYDVSYDRAEQFFKNWGPKECIRLTPREAEFGKLVTNMYRYVNFALANEFYMLANKHKVNMEKVTQAVNKDYSRMLLPLPGPNVGGPCLYKDGKFLLQDVPYADLIQVSFLINEGMPEYIFNLIKEKQPNLKKVAILGMTFKAESDDIRNSLSFKFKKICERNGVYVDMYDPYWKTSEKNMWEYGNHPWVDYNAIVVMTPHKEFIDTFELSISKQVNNSCVIADPWKLFQRSKQTHNGVYLA